MTVTHDPAECRRLVAEAREDDERMSLNCTALAYDTSPESRAAIARTRNNLLSIADQLDAACAEVNHWKGYVKSWTDAERDSLRQQLEAARTEVDEVARRGRSEVAGLQTANDHLRGLLEGAQANLVTTETERDSLRAEMDRQRLLVEAGMAAYAELDTEHGLRQQLRVILPVHRAAKAHAGWQPRSTALDKGSIGKLCRVVDAAISAITPEIASLLAEIVLAEIEKP